MTIFPIKRDVMAHVHQQRELLQKQNQKSSNQLASNADSQASAIWLPVGAVTLSVIIIIAWLAGSVVTDSDASLNSLGNVGASRTSANVDTGKDDSTGFGQQGSVTVSTRSPWVINLVSLSNKEGAERFAAEALSKDIQVEQYAVNIKGKEYWRVHAIGFSTIQEAISQANIIKEKLGLRDVWIKKG